MFAKSIHSSSSTEPATTPWSDTLQQCYKENYGTKGIQTSLPILSSVNGTPSVKYIDFASFCETDERVIVFSAKCNNSSLIGNLRSSPSNTIIWEMNDGNRFTISGKSYLVAAPSLSHRFGTPPKRIALPKDVTPETYWETSREKTWSDLTPQARAAYTWPSSSSPKHAVDVVESIYSDARSKSNSKVGLHVGNEELNFNLMKLDETPGTEEPAKDNLCLVVFKVQTIEIYEPASVISPPQRVVHDAGKDGKTWSSVEMNP
jgi:hypothetical protein